MSKPVEILRYAESLLYSPDVWLQCVECTDENNEVVTIESGEAVNFCLSAAIAQAGYNLADDVECEYSHKSVQAAAKGVDICEDVITANFAINVVTGKRTAKFNDHDDTDYGMVIQAINDAVKFLEDEYEHD